MNFDDERPLFIQIAQAIEDGILSGAFAEETQIPSTTELSVNYRINPATALKGINLLVDKQVVYKKRGVGMFVKEGAVDKIRSARKEEFNTNVVAKLVKEAKKIGLTAGEVIEMIERGMTK